MKDNKCELCGGDGTFKTKDGTMKRFGLIAVPPFQKNIDLRNVKSFHWRCIKCIYKKMSLDNYTGNKGNISTIKQLNNRGCISCGM